jgi:hypothetical protein
MAKPISVAISKSVFRLFNFAHDQPHRAAAVCACIVGFTLAYEAYGKRHLVIGQGTYQFDQTVDEQEKYEIDGARLYVRGSQLDRRENTWALRMQERNWSVLQRDQQRQKDEYAYRKDRSRDNDYNRHL